MSCSYVNIRKPSEEERIIFGSGGGFTGIASFYQLHKDGSIYRSGNTDTSLIFVGKIQLREATQMYDSYEVLKIDSISLNEPGNRYYFIEKKDKRGNNHRVIWGYRSLENNSLPIFHDILMNHIKVLNKTKKE